MNKQILYSAILSTLLILSIGMSTAYQVQDGVAYINDSRVYIEAPLLITGAHPTIHGLARTKTFDGNINVLYGFNTDNLIPQSGSYTTNTILEKSLTCDYQFRVEGNEVTCYESVGIEGNESEHIKWVQEYDSYNLNTNTIFWDVVERENIRINTVNKINNFVVGDKDLWYMLENIPISPTNPYEWSIQFEIPIGKDAKYDIVLYPSSYGNTRQNIVEAFNDGNVYILDPFINNTHYEIGNVTNGTNTWDVDNGTETTIEISGDGKTFTYGELTNPTGDAIEKLSINDTETTLDNSGTGSNFFFVQSFTVPDNAIWNIDTVEPYLQNGSSGFGTDVIGGKFNIEIYNGLVSNSWKGATLVGNESDVPIKEHGAFSSGVLPRNYSVPSWPNLNGSGTYTIVFRFADVGSNSGAQFYASRGTETYPRGSGNYSGSQSFNADRNIDLWGYEKQFNTSKNLYKSITIPIAFNASSFDITYECTGVGSCGVNVTCNADDVTPSYTGALISGTKDVSCPVIGDNLEYDVILAGGNNTDSPVMQNVTMVFSEDILVNTPPQITNISLSPTSPNSTQDITASTTYTDNESDNGTVFFYWSVAGVSVLNDTDTVNDTGIATSILSRNFTSNGDVVSVLVNATDGTNFTETKSAVVTVEDAAITKETSVNELAVVILFAILLIGTIVLSSMVFAEYGIVLSIINIIIVSTGSITLSFLDQKYLILITFIVFVINVTILFKENDV